MESGGECRVESRGESGEWRGVESGGERGEWRGVREWRVEGRVESEEE